MSEPVIAVSGLNKAFGSLQAVKDFSITVERGRICGFLGPNGAGKTTTLRMLCGLLTPDSGRGTVLGLDVMTQAREIKQRVGYMTQKFSLYEDLSVEENLSFAARVRELDGRKARVDQAIERLGLTARRKQLAGTLSGGWKQRLALAVATLHRPDLLLLDEPTAGVDPEARRTFWDEIHALAAKGLTVLVSTHYMDEAERCHRINYIAYGTLVARGTVEEVVAEAGLTTLLLTGTAGQTAEAGAKLKGAEGVEQVAHFGADLHVVGRDAGALRATAERVAGETGCTLSASETSLEDVFIRLMSESADNMA